MHKILSFIQNEMITGYFFATLMVMLSKIIFHNDGNKMYMMCSGQGLWLYIKQINLLFYFPFIYLEHNMKLI